MTRPSPPLSGGLELGHLTLGTSGDLEEVGGKDRALTLTVLTEDLSVETSFTRHTPNRLVLVVAVLVTQLLISAHHLLGFTGFQESLATVGELGGRTITFDQAHFLEPMKRVVVQRQSVPVSHPLQQV